MSHPNENRGEFYVGYLPQMPPGYARVIRPVVALLLVSAAVLAYVLPKLHNSYDLGRSDYRDIRDFEGLLLAKPAPQLVMMRPGNSGSQQLSSYLLVGRGKSGPKIDIEALDGKYVTVKGSLIYRVTAQFAWFRSISVLTPATIAKWTVMTPVLAMGYAFLINGETPGQTQLIALSFVTLGTLVSNVGKFTPKGVSDSGEASISAS